MRVLITGGTGFIGSHLSTALASAGHEIVLVDRCPPGHSRMLYRALKEYVKVPTELIVYPGEGHGIAKYRNRRAKLEWDVAWLDRWVMGKK